MNSPTGKNIFTLCGIVILMFLVTLDVFAGDWNQLGRMMRWIAIVGGLYGLIFPKRGVLVFLVSLFYLDFLKRLLILWSGTSMQDVMVSIGAGPVIIVAICISCTILIIAQRIKFGKFGDWLFYLGCVVVSVSGIFGEGEDWMERGQAMMGSSLVGMTALASYCLYRERADSLKLLKVLVIGALPMALYTAWQYFNGIAMWEEEYIQTGLSATLYNFYLVDGGVEYMRPFSTLNLHPSVGAVSGVLCILAFLLCGNREGIGTKAFYSMIGVIFFSSMLFAQNRTTYFIPLFYLAFTWGFKNQGRTLLLYTVGVILFGLMIHYSAFIYDNINAWSDGLTSTPVGEKLGTLGTYQDRLEGFMNLSEVENWKPLGFEEGFEPLSHDPLSMILFRFGYVPLGSMLAAVAGVLVVWHRKLYKMQSDDDRIYYTRLTAVVAALVLSGLLYGNLLFVSPVNAVLGALVGVVFGGIRDTGRRNLGRSMSDLNAENTDNGE
ncbi:hypothetical protein ACFPK9_08710 [Rubritalea spongiae]|uniref:O-antigen ligase domain-containing protein n=1 Tax=Rubritalea spongiae TaxID=430797 RepID=A0ABW5E2I6_9BACT